LRPSHRRRLSSGRLVAHGRERLCRRASDLNRHQPTTVRAHVQRAIDQSATTRAL
jgi:hypothetical protein